MNEQLFLEQCKRACRFLNEDVKEEDLLPPDDEDAGFEDLPADEPVDDEDEECDGCVPCPDCNGTGVITDEDGEEVECPTCGGTGEVELEDAEYDFDPESGVCPCCGAKLNVIEPEEDDLAGEDDLDGDETDEDDLEDEEELEDFDEE